MTKLSISVILGHDKIMQLSDYLTAPLPASEVVRVLTKGVWFPVAFFFFLINIPKMILIRVCRKEMRTKINK